MRAQRSPHPDPAPENKYGCVNLLHPALFPPLSVQLGPLADAGTTAPFRGRGGGRCSERPGASELFSEGAGQGLTLLLPGKDASPGGSCQRD